MPKRNSEEKIQEYYAKIRKLVKRRRRIVISSSDSEDNLENGIKVTSGTSCDDPAPRASPPPVTTQPLSPAPSLLELTAHEDVPLHNQDAIFDPEPPVAEPLLPPGSTLAEEDPNDTELDPELLEALGEASEEAADFGPNIHNKIAQRWLPILKKGLQAEAKEKLLKELSIPENCKLLKAPILNPEISAAISNTVICRDKTLATRQNHLGLGISAISRGLTTLLSSDDKTAAIKCLSDGCRLLTDLHFEHSKLRKKLIEPSLEKSIQSILSERDETLFGSDLPEKIKSTKAIEKQGQQIKKPIPQKSTTSNASAAPAARPRGNWTGPPRPPARYAPGRGGRTAPQWSQYRRETPTAPPARAPAPQPPRYTHRPPPASKRSSH